MNKKIYTKIAQVALIFTMLFTMSSQAFADSNISTNDAIAPMSDVYTYKWVFKNPQLNYTQVDGKTINFYIGKPSQRDGEIDSISHSFSYAHEFTGSITAGYKKTVEGMVGYTFGTEKTYQAVKQSAPLKVGEYVKGYATPYYSQSKIVHEQHKFLNGIDTKVVTASNICYPKQSKGVSLELKYFKKSGTLKYTQVVEL
ncbi:hypothetical protein Ami103574_11685 [Aminipila butyrica]|uniref:Uncharacterized protein n=1 Tax=Aminipila butyrica TaxID=433296 RepID=A0A858BV63_9FIRM|nr:hypothetical protein [Aminipila butyrica]QIB69941.1 hypothetical protein Ami103574_11685 [Aminipila butyrica]